MAEDLVELGLEGFDRLVDKYHDSAYKTFTDKSGTIWKKVYFKGSKKGVYVEQNSGPDKPQIYDPAKEEEPEGWRPHKDEQRGDQRDLGDQSRGPERDYFGGDNPDSPRKPYRNEVPRGADAGIPPPQQGEYYAQPPQGGYYPPPPRGPVDDDYNLNRYNTTGHAPQQTYPDGWQDPRYLAPVAGAAAGAYYGNQARSPREHENSPRDEYFDGRRDRGRSHDGRRQSRYESDSDDHSPPRRRNRSEDPRRDRRKSKSKDKDNSLAGGLAGALAGGFLGHKLGKGDLVTSAAGAVVGALGGTIAVDGRQQVKDERRYREKEYRKNKQY